MLELELTAAVFDMAAAMPPVIKSTTKLFDLVEVVVIL